MNIAFLLLTISSVVFGVGGFPSRLSSSPSPSPLQSHSLSLFPSLPSSLSSLTSTSTSTFTSSTPNAPVYVYVSESGTMAADCGGGEGPLGCATVVSACSQVIDGGAGEVIVGKGTYTETKGVTVTGLLAITGQSRGACFLSKDGAFVLFTLASNDAGLTVANLTLLLTDDTAAHNLVRSSDVNTTVAVTFRACDITMAGGLAEILGQSFFIDNTKATLGFELCAVANVTCSGKYPVIYCPRLSSLWMVGSSFANVHGADSGGCFRVSANLTLVESKFAACSSASDGVGDCWVANGSAIRSCGFWNVSATSDDGVLVCIGSSEYFNDYMALANVSCVFCSCNDNGGAILLSNAEPDVMDCSFIRCSCGRSGGALTINYCSAVIARCTFVECTAARGGAVYVLGQANTTVVDSVFVRNEASQGGGRDFYVYDHSHLIVTSGYTDANTTDISIYLNHQSDLTGSLTVRGAYSSTTCSANFAAVWNGSTCPMPCASASPWFSWSQGVCYKAGECPADFLSVGGACVPACTFWTPLPSSPLLSSSTCSAWCVPDYSLGYPLCRSVDPQTLLPCSVRVPNATASLPCAAADCYWQPDLLSCASTCPTHYGDDGSGRGRCVLLGCGVRRAQLSALRPCGDGPSSCYLQPDNYSCASDCPSAHYVPDGGAGTGTGPGAGTGAGAEAGTGPNEGTRCVLKGCAARVDNASALFRCGEGCYLQPPSSSLPCGRDCPALHYAPRSDGVCVEMACSLRGVSEENEEGGVLPCGSLPCYLQPSGSECGLSCPEGLSNSTEQQHGKCGEATAAIKSNAGGDSGAGVTLPAVIAVVASAVAIAACVVVVVAAVVMVRKGRKGSGDQGEMAMNMMRDGDDAHSVDDRALRERRKELQREAEEV